MGETFFKKENYNSKTNQLIKKERKRVKSLSRDQLFASPWTVAHQAPPSMEFSRQENWSGLPFPSPGDLPDSGIKPGSSTLQVNALLSEPPVPIKKGKEKLCNFLFKKEEKRKTLPKSSSHQQIWCKYSKKKTSYQKNNTISK